MVRLVPPWARPRLGRLPGDPEPEQVLVVPGPVEDAPALVVNFDGELTPENVEVVRQAIRDHVFGQPEPEPEPEPLPEGVLGYAVGVWSGGDFLGFTHTTSLSRESAEDEVACWNKRRDDARTLGAAAACWRVVEVRLP